jgi:hypothetical protein
LAAPVCRVCDFCLIFVPFGHYDELKILSYAICSANVRDYAAVVVEDCVDTMDGPELHDAALRCIQTAFGWVMPAKQVLREFSGGIS